MKVISFHDSDRQDHWLEEIKRSNWKSGAFLYELLSQGAFFDTVGEDSKVLLLIDGDELISYCTYAQKDDIQPTELTPWMGFVYTFPEHRGHRYVEMLFKEIERLAQEEQVSQVYISANHVGLYEKYGCEFLTEMNDIDGNPSRVYVKKVDITENNMKEPKSIDVEEPETIEEEPKTIEVEEPETVEVEKTKTMEVEEPETMEVEMSKSQEIESRNKTSKTKKILRYLTTKKKRAVLKRAFHIWQVTPPKLAPLSKSTHECASCGTEYQGNYCPRCGQSSTIGRFSFKKAALLFLDVWGLGNRSMFRSLRDLMLRPGYMIRDYLSGMQTAYFPPFKMFFILLTFSLIVEQGIKLNIDATTPQPTGNQIEMVKQEKEEVKKEISDNAYKKFNKTEQKIYSYVMRFVNLMDAMLEKYPAIFSLVTILLFFWPMYFFLRHSPKIPDLQFSEFIVEMVYTSNTFTIFLILGDLFNSDILKFFAVFMIFVAISQFSGYKKWRILGYLILTFIISITALVLVGTSGMGVLALFANK